MNLRGLNPGIFTIKNSNWSEFPGRGESSVTPNAKTKSTSLFAEAVEFWSGWGWVAVEEAMRLIRRGREFYTSLVHIGAGREPTWA